jgi:TolA-binding protein
MTEISWAENIANLKQLSLDSQLIEMQRQIDELNSKVTNLEQASENSTTNEEQVES